MRLQQNDSRSWAKDEDKSRPYSKCTNGVRAKYYGLLSHILLLQGQRWP